MPRSVRALLAVVIAAGSAVVVVCAVGIAGDPIHDRWLLAVLAGGILIAELNPIRIPGGGEEASFSTSFSLALLVTHGTEVTVVVSVACMVLADVIRRAVPIKIVYNAAQYALSWALAGVIYRLFAGEPVALSRSACASSPRSSRPVWPTGWSTARSPNCRPRSCAAVRCCR